MKSQPAAIDLISQLRERVAAGPVSAFEKKGYAIKAEKLKEADPPQAYAVLGVLACLDQNVAMMRENHGKALLASGNDSMQMHNFACSLSRCGFLEEAARYSHDAVASVPTSSLFMGTYVTILFLAKHTDELAQALASWKRATGSAHPAEESLAAVGFFENYARIIEAEKNGAPADEIAMYKGMLLDTDEELVKACTLSSQASLSRIWDKPGEDTAWADL